MQNISTTLQTALEATTLTAWPKLIAEFNQNITRSGVSVSVPAGRDESLFPPESVVDLKYSKSGLPKFIVGNSKVNSQEDDVQFRLVSENDEYQYWPSPTASLANGSIANASVEVNYGSTRSVNKVFVWFEVSDSAPTSVDLEVMVGGFWETVATGISPGADGVIERFYNGTSWVTTEQLGSTIDITRVRATVNTMAAEGKYAQFLQVGASLVHDFSDRVVSWSITKNQEESDPIVPIGFGSANKLEVTLENADAALDPENTSSIFYGNLSRNVIFKPYMVYETSAGEEEVPQGTFYTESWPSDVPSVESTVSATDLSRPMQEAFVPSFFLQDYREKDVVKEILQRGGFSDFVSDVDDTTRTLPYFWHESESSVWESLSEVASATLSYLITKEDNSLLWQNISQQYDRPVDRALSAGHDFEDINHEFNTLVNKVLINYNIYNKPYDKWAEEEITQELWYAQDDEALVALPIAESFTSTADVVRVSASDETFALWPDSGTFAIQGERIRYGAKRKDGGNYEFYDLERGVLGTSPRNHSASGTATQSTSGGSVTATQEIIDGQLELSASNAATYGTYNYALYGDASSQFTVYGTRVSFPEERPDAVAGMTIHNTGSAGYHFMISTTAHANKTSTNEIKVYKYTGSGRTPIGATVGYPYEVDISAWYDMEVVASYGGTPAYTLYINGEEIMSFADGDYQQGQYGMYVKGRTTARFDRLYIASPTETPDLTNNRYSDPDSASSWSSDYWFSATGPNVDVNEFGPYIRQIKEFNVDFQKYPATHSKLLNTNIWQTRPFNFVGGPFDASFGIENITTRTAVVNGESRVFTEPVEMALLVYGVPIIVESEESKEVIDKSSVRRFGVVELEVSTPWIQNDNMANRVGNFLKDRFGADEVDNISMRIVSDPSIQIGDTVSVDYPERGYTNATHEYIVTGYTLEWEQGFFSTLSLKRRR